MDKHVVILADGDFPVHNIPLDSLRSAEIIVCCDGAATGLVAFGLEPYAIVGDCDSLSADIELKYPTRVYRDPDQETNDLTKAVKWCISEGYSSLSILGATGKREDHTIANISLLTEYSEYCSVKMLTDTGIILPVKHSSVIKSYPGQQVSIFSLDPSVPVTSAGLRYPLTAKKIGSWWQASLNEATGDEFTLDFLNGKLIVYLKY